jgi:hypothetical protein
MPYQAKLLKLLTENFLSSVLDYCCHFYIELLLENKAILMPESVKYYQFILS